MIIGPFALLCILMLCFRPLRLLAMSLVLSVMFVVVNAVGSDAAQPATPLGAVLLAQGIFWALVAWRASAKRARNTRDIATAVSRALEKASRADGRTAR
jgi:hypothetical protein